MNVSADKKRIGEVLDELRKQTGANIVLDPRCEDNAKRDPLTLSLSNVYLYDTLRVIADLQGLKMVYTSNIYYVTNVENAKNFFPTPPPTANTPRPATKKPTPAPADSKQP